MSSGGLTEEQRRRIEENRRKALEKRAALLSQRQQKNASATTTSSATDRCDGGKFATNRAVKPSREENSLFSSSRDNTSVPQRQPSLKSGGDTPSSNLQSMNRASNSYMYTNGHAKPHVVGSANTSVGSTTLVSKPSAGPASLNSFQSTISKFYRPQDASSSSIRKLALETNPNSNSSTTSSNSASVSAKNSAVSSKSSAAFNSNIRGKSEKPVKGNCVLISRQRFTVVVPYQAQLIGIFKTIPSRSYGKSHSILSWAVGRWV